MGQYRHQSRWPWRSRWQRGRSCSSQGTAFEDSNLRSCIPVEGCRRQAEGAEASVVGGYARCDAVDKRLWMQRQVELCEIPLAEFVDQIIAVRDGEVR